MDGCGTRQPNWSAILCTGTVPFLVLVLIAGCTRNHYRLRADRDTYDILSEKAAGTSWQVPEGFTVYPHPQSRFYDPTCLNDPLLPIPAPQLYAYELPQLSTRKQAGSSAPEFIPPGEAAEDAGDEEPAATKVRPATYQEDPEESSPEASPDDLPLPGLENVPSPTGEPTLEIVPIPDDAWNAIPANCLDRMLEFDSVQEEFQRTFRTAQSGPDDGQRKLTLEEIVQLALINSRDYQTRKELLYATALRLTLERYDYQLKFAPGGSGVDVDYRHSRRGGETINTLAVPSQVTMNKMLVTGGDLLARFANDVVMTFNGPDGFAADVSSELLFDLQQSVFQRDIRFEALTQAERDVVYAARDFARFRKILFRDLAAQYYGLLLSYRTIEIGAQDYFSNYRAFQQGQAKYRARQLPRFQLDQLEQNALSSRSNLIRSCNDLESQLDRFKLLIGVPPETLMNLDLRELEQLTLRDEATVARELVRRTRRNLLAEREQADPDRMVQLSFAAELTRRLLNLSELQEQIGEEPLDASLELMLLEFEAGESWQVVQFNRQVLAQQQASGQATPLLILGRTMELVDALLTYSSRQLALQQAQAQAAAGREQVAEELEQLRAEHLRLVQQQAAVSAAAQMQRIPELVDSASVLLMQAEQLAGRAAQLVTQAPPAEAPQVAFQSSLQRVEELVGMSEQILAADGQGLAPVEIEMDEAMLTALVQRLDLMNERGSLADVWRQIKLAGDDLKSVLNLNATQVIRTRADVNRPFAFTFDESETRLRMQLDTPFNRRAQRNSFRLSLIDYQRGLRNLMEAEDVIKLAIRDDLRELQLDRHQYDIAVASAALAYERVISTRLQLQHGLENVAVRDFLESQQAYTQSLSNVARQHIDYIVDRIDLFLDLESLEVDEQGFWPELYREQFQPQPNLMFPPDGYPPYGTLPPVWYSKDVRRMHEIPPGHPTIYHVPSAEAERNEAAEKSPASRP